MFNNVRSDSFSYWSYCIVYCVFIYLFSVFFLQQYILNSCSLSLDGNDWSAYINTAEIISNLDWVGHCSFTGSMGECRSRVLAVGLRIKPGRRSGIYTPILNTSVIALSMALARPLLNSFSS